MQPGDYAIPALTVQVDGQTLKSQPLTLKAVKAVATAGNPGGDQLAYFKLVIPKKEVFVGEVVIVELQVYVREGVANANNILASVDRFEGSLLKADNFTVLKSAHAQGRRVQVGNAIYGVATLVNAVSPVKAGTLSIGAQDTQLTLQMRRDPYDLFGIPRQVVLTAEPQTLTVLPLPKDKVPPGFNGAIGNFTLAVNAGPTTVAAGDPITVRVQIAGRGAFDSLKLPEQTTWRGFKTLPPSEKIEAPDALGIQATKTFEQVVMPENGDVKALPPFYFSFFDPDKKSYQTLTSQPVPLIVKPSVAAPVPTVAASASRGQDAPPPTRDIVHIKPRIGVLAQTGPPLMRQPWFVALQGVPLLGWLSVLAWRRRADQFANNPRLRRQRQVAQVVREGLDQLRQFASGNKSEDFFATMVHLLQEQLGERLDLPASAITEAVIDEHLRPHGVPETVLAPLHELFQTCNLARYAPVKSSQELAALVPKLEAVLRDLQTLEVKA
jgi:hypothetical protein